MPVLSPKGREQMFQFEIQRELYHLLFLAEICVLFHYLGNNFDKKQIFLTCCRNSSSLPAIVLDLWQKGWCIFKSRQLSGGLLPVPTVCRKKKLLFPGLFSLHFCTSLSHPTAGCGETLHCWCCALLAGSRRGRVISLSYPIPQDFDFFITQCVLWCVIDVILSNSAVE